MEHLEARVDDVRDRVRDACAQAGRSEASVTLVAVSKQRSVEEIRRAYDAGLRDFGESRAKEMFRKAVQLPADVRWHFLGPLQSNRTRILQESAHLVHAFDRVDLAPKWGRYEKPRSVLLQVNVAGESQKRGVAPEEMAGALESLQAQGVPCTGLMIMPPWADDPEESVPHFRYATKLLEDLQADHPDLKQLSMGTSQDFEVAIREGATHVRVGTAIFGERDYPDRDE